MLWLAALLSCTQTTPRPSQPVVPVEQLQAEARVILVTIDGVRWQEATDPEVLPVLSDWAVFGDHTKGSRVTTSSIRPLSMPGYHALMAGFTTPCADNDCDRIAVQTLPERIIADLSLQQSEVGVFCSWAAIPRSVASQSPVSFILDSAIDPAAPWPNARLDAQTIVRAMRYLEGYRPRFLWISLLDTDEFAHRDQREGYDLSLEQIDQWLVVLQEKLVEMGVAEQTTIILTTDHGRGRGPFWTSHGSIPAATQMWLAATGPWVGMSGVVSGGPRIHQADVRPTIEALLGLPPTPCEADGCGQVIPEIASR